MKNILFILLLNISLFGNASEGKEIACLNDSRTQSLELRYQNVSHQDFAFRYGFVPNLNKPFEGLPRYRLLYLAIADHIVEFAKYRNVRLWINRIFVETEETLIRDEAEKIAFKFKNIMEAKIDDPLVYEILRRAHISESEYVMASREWKEHFTDAVLDSDTRLEILTDNIVQTLRHPDYTKVEPTINGVFVTLKRYKRFFILNKKPLFSYRNENFQQSKNFILNLRSSFASNIFSDFSRPTLNQVISHYEQRLSLQIREGKIDFQYFLDFFNIHYLPVTFTQFKRLAEILRKLVAVSGSSEGEKFLNAYSSLVIDLHHAPTPYQLEYILSHPLGKLRYSDVRLKLKKRFPKQY